MLLSESYRDPDWPKGWHIYRVAGRVNWRLFYETAAGKWEWRQTYTDDRAQAAAILAEMAR